MRTLECTIFNVEHGLCIFVRSPNGYGLLIDCGSRSRFSPIKWIRRNYNVNTPDFRYYEGRQYAEMIITHNHHDHFSDIGSFKSDADKPRTLSRDKETLKFLEEKLHEAKETGDDRKLDDIQAYLDFSSGYTEDVENEPDWGFDMLKRYRVPYSVADRVSAGRDNVINNRSSVVGIGFGGKKILIPGDIEIAGWNEVLNSSVGRATIENTDFFVTSHHGHKSGFTSRILEVTGKPDIFITSAKSGDSHIDSSYSKSENSSGYVLLGDRAKSHSVSTRGSGERSLRIVIREDGASKMERFRAEDNLSDNQSRLRKRRTKQATADWR